MIRCWLFGVIVAAAFRAGTNGDILLEFLGSVKSSPGSAAMVLPVSVKPIFHAVIAQIARVAIAAERQSLMLQTATAEVMTLANLHDCGVSGDFGTVKVDSLAHLLHNHLVREIVWIMTSCTDTVQWVPRIAVGSSRHRWIKFPVVGMEDTIFDAARMAQQLRLIDLFEFVNRAFVKDASCTDVSLTVLCPRTLAKKQIPTFYLQTSWVVACWKWRTTILIMLGKGARVFAFDARLDGV